MYALPMHTRIDGVLFRVRVTVYGYQYERSLRIIQVHITRTVMVVSAIIHDAQQIKTVHKSVEDDQHTRNTLA